MNFCVYVCGCVCCGVLVTSEDSLHELALLPSSPRDWVRSALLTTTASICWAILPDQFFFFWLLKIINGQKHTCPIFETNLPVVCYSRKLIPWLRMKNETYISIRCIAMSEVMRVWLIVPRSFDLACLTLRFPLSLVSKPNKESSVDQAQTAFSRLRFLSLPRILQTRFTGWG